MSRDKHGRIAELENQVLIAKLMARHFWTTLAARVDRATALLFESGLNVDRRRVVDVAFDAAETVWERHRIMVEPCRKILDGQAKITLVSGPAQPEMYLGRWPGGDVRTITRAQLLMMAGMDADA